MITKNYRNHKSSTNGIFTLDALNMRFYGNLDNQRDFFFKLKYPSGYVCPECGHTECSWIKNRSGFQCKRCCKQDYLFANTVFQNTKLSLYQLIVGMYFFVSSQAGISGTTLATYMGCNVGASRLFLRKLRTVCKNENDLVKLGTLIDFDGGYFGGVDQGGKRGLGSNKQTVLVGQEIIQKKHYKTGEIIEYPGHAKVMLVTSENGDDVISFMNKNVEKHTVVRTDGAPAMKVLNQVYKNVEGDVVIGKDGTSIKKHPYKLEQETFDKVDNPMTFLHTFISNAKSMILGVYHGLSLGYLDLYLEEYVWRYNQRNTYSNLSKIEILTKGIFNTEVMTENQLKENYQNNNLIISTTN